METEIRLLTKLIVEKLTDLDVIDRDVALIFHTPDTLELELEGPIIRKRYSALDPVVRLSLCQVA